jgi:hypothetical protein
MKPNPIHNKISLIPLSFPSLFPSPLKLSSPKLNQTKSYSSLEYIREKDN